MLHDIQNWNKEKEEQFEYRKAEKARLQKIADEREAKKLEEE